MCMDTEGDEETAGLTNLSINKMIERHVPALYFNFHKDEVTSRPLCMICSINEMARAHILQLTR